MNKIATRPYCSFHHFYLFITFLLCAWCLSDICRKKLRAREMGRAREILEQPTKSIFHGMEFLPSFRASNQFLMRSKTHGIYTMCILNCAIRACQRIINIEHKVLVMNAKYTHSVCIIIIVMNWSRFITTIFCFFSLSPSPSLLVIFGFFNMQIGQVLFSP